MDTEAITPEQLLEISRKAASNGAEKPAFKQMLAVLNGFPKTQERLVFEFLALALRRLDAGENPGEQIAWGVIWALSVEQPRMPEYLTLLERIILRYFDILARSELDPGIVQSHALSLAIALGAIRKLDQSRFRALAETLASQCRQRGSESGEQVLKEVEGLLRHAEKGPGKE